MSPTQILFRPCDEMSLRHLFSSAFSEQALKLSYVGPAFGPSGSQSSPDSTILDRRANRYRFSRCEFKFRPSSHKDFGSNGKFDLAIVWELAPGLDRHTFEKAMRTNHGCREVLVLSDELYFQNLPELSSVTLRDPTAFEGRDRVQERLEKLSYPQSSVVAYIAAKLGHNAFRTMKMIEWVEEKWPGINPSGKGRHAIVTAVWMRDKPPLVVGAGVKHWKKWNTDLQDSEIAVEVISQHIRKLRFPIPSEAEIQRFLNDYSLYWRAPLI